MISSNDVQNLLGRGGIVTDADGSKIGKVGQVYLDNQTGDPQWVTVSTGLFGTSESFVPLTSATTSGNDIQVPFTKDVVHNAPRIDADAEISEAEEAELFRYYDIPTADSTPRTTDADKSTANGGNSLRRDRAGDADVVGQDTSGPTTDNAMTRSEEQLFVGTQNVETGKARLRKYIVTENVTQTVPVSHEEVRIEREPITDANVGDAVAGGDLTEEEHEVTLSAEQVVVNKETVPVERVRLDTDTVTEDQTLTEEVRKEQIDTDQGADGDRRPR
ncbi:MAG TPA: PRC and DUF2382 domain-containing protein [Microlunatus sp.]|nr:PRC and DUF2382 domain-containing protein [Microlunatus sp.]